MRGSHPPFRQGYEMAITPGRLEDVFGKYASGVTVVTCLNADGEPHGATVTAFTAVSHTPYLCQVTLTKKVAGMSVPR